MSKFSQVILTKSPIVIAMLGVSSASFAAGLEQSSQSIAPLFEDGNYAELTYAYVQPNMTGKDVGGNHISNMMENFGFPGAAVKIAPTPNTALAVMYQEPWGINTTYPTGNLFSNSTDVTSAKFKSKNITLLGGGKTDSNVWLYGGVAAEQVKADVKIATVIPTSATTFADVNYGLHTDNSTTAIAPVVGIGFQKPEIALKTSLTYRGAMKHQINGVETLNLAGGQPVPGGITLKMPQSVNFDFQTGLSEKYKLLGSLNARWVNWKQFDVNPSLYAQTLGTATNGEHLANYTNDGYSVEAALGHEFNPKLSGEIRVGYDHGTGQPVNPLGPYDKVKFVAVGAEYKVTPKMSLAGGVQYASLQGGDIVSGGQPMATIDDGHAVAYGVKLGYHF